MPKYRGRKKLLTPDTIAQLRVPKPVLEPFPYFREFEENDHGLQNSLLKLATYNIWGQGIRNWRIWSVMYYENLVVTSRHDMQTCYFNADLRTCGINSNHAQEYRCRYGLHCDDMAHGAVCFNVM